MNRRELLRAGAAAAAGTVTARGRARAATNGQASGLPAFPNDFLFGAATSCVQIEGAAREDGKSESIWDRFAAQPGATEDGSTPAVACDSYHRWEQDFALLKTMGLQSYRFSIAWPRILPDGKGQVNEKGVDHYNRQIDRLLAMRIQPLVTAYHWDLPQVLEDAGGWPNRDTAARFADYVQVLARRFGDRVTRWCLMNEMQAFAVAGYGWGVHAPGRRDRGLTLRAAHTSNLAQGAACRALKAERPRVQAGVAHDMVLFDPATPADADREACRRFDAFRNLWYLDPPFTGKYPEAFVDGVPYEAMGWKPGDEDRMRAPLDFSGMNFYGGRLLVSAGDKAPLLKGLNAHQSSEDRAYAGAMERACLWMWNRYRRPVVITETGWEAPDVVAAGGKVHDPARIEYLRDAFAGVRRAMLQGADVRGVHVWSLIDDWEWQGGFKYRIGLAWVDFKNPVDRIAKDSAEWYAKVARSRRLDA